MTASTALRAFPTAFVADEERRALELELEVFARAAMVIEVESMANGTRVNLELNLETLE